MAPKTIRTRSRRNIESEIRSRLLQMQKDRNRVVKFLDEILQEAQTAADTLLEEPSKKQFKLKFEQTLNVLNTYYRQLISVSDKVGEDGDVTDDSSSTTSTSSSEDRSISSEVSLVSAQSTFFAKCASNINSKMQLKKTDADVNAAGDSNQKVVNVDQLKSRPTTLCKTSLSESQLSTASSSSTLAGDEQFRSTSSCCYQYPTWELKAKVDVEPKENNRDINLMDFKSSDCKEGTIQLKSKDEDGECSTVVGRTSQESTPRARRASDVFHLDLPEKSESENVQMLLPTTTRGLVSYEESNFGSIDSARSEAETPPVTQREAIMKVDSQCEDNSGHCESSDAVKELVKVSIPKLVDASYSGCGSTESLIKSGSDGKSLNGRENLTPLELKVRTRRSPTGQSTELSPLVSNAGGGASNNLLRVYPIELEHGSRVEVNIADVKSPHDFWVELVGDESTGKLEFLLNKQCTNAKKVGASLIRGLHCCAWSTLEELWFRAEVTRIQYSEKKVTSGQNNCPSFVVSSVTVRHLDLGTVNTLHPDHLRHLDEECAAYPATAIHCRLGRIESEDWTSEAIDCFRNLVSDGSVFQMKILSYLPNKIAIVDLAAEVDGQPDEFTDIADYLVNSNFARYVDGGGNSIVGNQSAKSENQAEFSKINEEAVTECKADMRPEGKEETAADGNKKKEIEETDTKEESSSKLEIEKTEDGNENNATILPYRESFTWSATIPTAAVPDNEFLVKVEDTTSPTSFFAHLQTEDTAVVDINLREELDKLEILYSDRIQPPLSFAVVEGSCWAGKYSLDNKWYRVRVLLVPKIVCDKRQKIHVKTNGLSVLVRFVDYGNEEWMNLSNLRPLFKKHSLIPALALHLSLAELIPVEMNPDWANDPCETWPWSARAVTDMKRLVNHPALRARLFEGKTTNKSDTVPVILYGSNDSKRSGFILNREMIVMGHARSSICFCENETGTQEILESECSEVCDEEAEVCDEEAEVCDEEAAVANWNPKLTAYRKGNTYGIDPNDAGYALTGYTAKDESWICRNFNSRRGCKNMNCQYAHVPFRESGTTMDNIPMVCNYKSMLELLKSETRVIVQVTAIFNPGHFYVNLPYGPDDYENLNECDDDHHQNGIEESLSTLQKALNKHYAHAVRTDNPNIFLSEGEIVAAKVDGGWYRAKVLIHHVEFETIEVECIDYGNWEEVHEDFIRPLEIEFVHLPAQAVQCFLANVTPIGRDKKLTWSKESRSWFEEKILGKFMLAKIHSINSDAAYISLYGLNDFPGSNISDDLVERGFGERVHEIVKEIRLPSVESTKKRTNLITYPG